MSRRTVSLGLAAPDLAPGYAAISELSRRRRRGRRPLLAVLALAGTLGALAATTIWLIR